MANPRKRVLITGASSGVGRAAAESFARDGYDVALLARGRDGLEDAAAAAEAHGAVAIVIEADVTDEKTLAQAAEEVRDVYGGLDVVVLNAALTVFGPFTEVETEDFAHVVEVTFLGAVNVTRAFLPLLEESGGVLVANGSLNSRVPLPGFSSYAAAKHAERGFLNTLAIELKAQGSPVRVAQLHPGPIDTPVWGQTKSAVDRLPRQPPVSDSPGRVAAALVGLAERPRGEVLFGAEAFVVDKLWSTVRVAGDLMLGGVFRWFMSGPRPARDAPGS